MSALEQAAAGPSMEDRLREVLPPWTHWSGSIFGGFTATWTTPAGTWSITTAGLMSNWPTLDGPGGKWAFGQRDADHIIGVLRALDAIPETPGTGTATCDTCDGKGVIACYGSYPGGPTACIDCHNTGEMPCPDCPGTGSADPDGGA